MVAVHPARFRSPAPLCPWVFLPLCFPSSDAAPPLHHFLGLCPASPPRPLLPLPPPSSSYLSLPNPQHSLASPVGAPGKRSVLLGRRPFHLIRSPPHLHLTHLTSPIPASLAPLPMHPTMPHTHRLPPRWLHPSADLTHPFHHHALSPCKYHAPTFAPPHFFHPLVVTLFTPGSPPPFRAPHPHSLPSPMSPGHLAPIHHHAFPLPTPCPASSPRSRDLQQGDAHPNTF